VGGGGGEIDSGGGGGDDGGAGDVDADDDRSKRRKKKKKKNTGQEETTFCHWNPNGLVNKEPIFKSFLSKRNAIYGGVAESHTYRDAHLSDKKWIWDPGSESRPNKDQDFPPGGIGALIDRSIAHSVVHTAKHSMWVRIELLNCTPIFVAECYFPHSSKTIEHTSAWKDIASKTKEFQEIGLVLIMGDFNAHIGLNNDVTDTAGRILRKFTTNLGLVIVNESSICKGGHTRVVDHIGGSRTETTIDYALVSAPLFQHIVSMEIVDDRMNSDHSPIIVKFRGLALAEGAGTPSREVWRVEKIPHESTPEYRDFVGAYQDAFTDWLDNAKSQIERCTLENIDHNSVADLLENSFQLCLDDVSEEQIGRKLIGPSSTPLMNKEIKALNKQRLDFERALRKTMKNPNSTQEERDHMVHHYRQAKASAIHASAARREELELEMFHQIEKNHSNSKLLWARAKSVSGGLRSSISPPPMAHNSAGEVETDIVGVLKVWKEFSSSIANPGNTEEGKYDDDYKEHTEARLERLRIVKLIQQVLDCTITRQEIFVAIRKLKVGKAPGLDGIITSILKAAADAIGTNELKSKNSVVDSLVFVFNYIFKHEVWPDRWSRGIVFPLYKQDSRLDPGNYRPITLLSVIGKLFGSVMEDRLSSWSEKTHAIVDEQGGFRRKRGTPDLIFMLREIILTRKARNQATLATFIDARKAYDTVWREGNFVRLHDLGVRGKLWRQLQVMNQDPKSKIRLPFGETEWFEVKRGVAQGAVESPWLYSCFVNALAEEMINKGMGIQIAGIRTPLLMYADDIVLLAGNISELRAMNQIVSDFAFRNRYSHNGEKSAVMAFNADKELLQAVESEPWVLSGEPVKVKQRYKYLGIDLLTNINDWTKYLTRITIEATHLSESLSWMCRRDSGLRPRSASTLWQAIVRPVLEYASEIWAGDIPKNLAANAERVQTNFARSILGLVGCQSIPNDIIRAEMGMEKLSSRWEKLRLGYWRRINVASPERTLTAVVSLRRKHVAWDYPGTKNGWMSGTKKLLVTRDLAQYWSDPSLCCSKSKQEWKKIAYDAVEKAEDISRRIRLANMNSSFAARYARVKSWAPMQAEFARFSGEIGRRGSLVHETYLDDHSEEIGRKLKMMCRIGCLPTLARVIREQKLLPSDAKCRLCASGKTEDLDHLLLECSAHNKHREKLYLDLDLALDRPCLENWKFTTMCARDKIDLLLGRSTGYAQVDDRIDKIAKRFLKKIWRGRKWLTVELNKIFEREDTPWALKCRG
jgi:hypothetical protein